VGAKVLGVALNRLKPKTSGYYYYYHYYYSSGEDGDETSKGKRRLSRKPQGWRRWLPRSS
jgi:hypothetical protein